jgi:tetratricopeptide (TPR) repeat protein
VKRQFSRFYRVFSVVLALFIYGCAAVPPKPPPEKIPEQVPGKAPEKAAEKAPVKDPFSVFPDRYRQQAMDHEKSGELPRALLCWEIVRALQPTDEEAGRKIAALKGQIQSLADQHFKKGVSHYQSRSIPAARKEFLLTLYYSPDHSDALSYLKEKLNEEDYLLYEVKEGETLKDIAKKVYNDPQKDSLIAYFNGLGKDPKLAPKTSLRLPLLETPQTKPVTEPRETPGETREYSSELKEKIGKATASFKSKNYKETLSITEEILLYNPSDKEARELMNASYYQMGKVSSQGKKYPEALEQFNRVDPGYQDVIALKASVERQLAEAHYISGIKYFTEEKLDQAVKEWEETLRLNPQHPKAKADRENALRLLQKLKEIK